MFDFRECFILFLFSQAINWIRHITSWEACPGLFSLGAFPTFWSHDFRHGSLYVESSEGGRGGLYWSDSLPSSLENLWKFLVFFFVLSVSCWNIRFGAISNFRPTNSTSFRENWRNRVHLFRQLWIFGTIFLPPFSRLRKRSPSIP